MSLRLPYPLSRHVCRLSLSAIFLTALIFSCGQLQAQDLFDQGSNLTDYHVQQARVIPKSTPTDQKTQYFSEQAGTTQTPPTHTQKSEQSLRQVNPPAAHISEAPAARIAIIIDDLGYSLQRGVNIARLPGPITLAILPHTPNGVALAELGHEQGKEIMLHAPMSTVAPRTMDPGGLNEHMTQEEFLRTLHNDLRSVPHIQGLNNHMGSYLTQLPEPMNWLMNELAQEELFFVDSRTSADSIAWQTAQQNRVPTRRRDVFLDNERTPAAIAKQFAKLIEIARRRGSAVAIGHPYPETHAFLAEILPHLKQLNVELTPISQLLRPAPLASSRQDLARQDSAENHDPFTKSSLTSH